MRIKVWILSAHYHLEVTQTMLLTKIRQRMLLHTFTVKHSVVNLLTPRGV